MYTTPFATTGASVVYWAPDVNDQILAPVDALNA